VAQALLHDPPVIVLDEPTDGLDPNQKHEMRSIIRAMQPRKAIIISTHLLEEVEAVCSRAIIVAHGRILADDTPAKLAARSRYHNAVRLAMPGLVKRLRQWVVMCSALAVAGTAYLLFPLVSSVPLLMALSFVLGLGLGCAQPVIMSLLYEASPPGRQGEAVGLRTSLLNGSHTLIPLASGALSAAAGMAPVFWLLAAFLLGGAWFARQRIK